MDDLQIIAEYPLSNAIPERDYFLQQEKGDNLEKYYPLGYGADKVYLAELNGKKLLLQKGKSDFYLITDVHNFGFSLVHYILHTDNRKVRLSDSLPIQQLFHYKEEFDMATTALERLNRMGLNARLGEGDTEVSYDAVQNGQQVQPMQQQPMQGTGITTSSKVDTTQLKELATAFGYIIGYISPNGPQLRMQLRKTTTKKQDSSKTESYSIVAVESKPSKATRVLAALPKGICMKGGQLASATEIQSGDFDFDSDNTDLAYFCWQEKTAIAYIGVLGKRLPEYAPTHTDSKSHPDPRDILMNKVDNLGYVQIVARENKKKDKTSDNLYNWYLKSTARRSLYTPKNFLPLKQFEHISIECKTEEDVYRLNEIAFGSLNNKVRDGENNRLDTACTHCPQLIFKRNYELMQDGQKTVVKDAICSSFFMVGEKMEVKTKVKNAEGKEEDVVREYPKASLTYIPWHATNIKGITPEAKPVTQILNKNKEITKQGSTRFKNIAIEFERTYGDNKYSKYWKPYENFIKTIAPCISVDGLKSLTAKDNNRKQFNQKPWSKDIENSFLLLTKHKDVVADHDAIVQNFSKEALIAKYGNR